MDFNLLYISLLISSSFIAIFPILFILKFYRKKGIIPAILMVGIAIWCTGYAMELLYNDLQQKILWAKIQYFGIVVIPATWLLLIMQYVGKERWVNKKTILLLSIEPLITLYLLWSRQNLIWEKINVIDYGVYSLLSFEYGAWAIVHAVYSYLLILFAISILFQVLLYAPYIYRKQVILLLIAVFAPIFGNMLYIIDLTQLDLTPFAFLISGLSLTYNFLHYKLLTIKPIALDYLVNQLIDGIVVIDNFNRIIMANPSAENLFGEKLIGKGIEELSISSKLRRILASRIKLKEEMQIKGKYFEIFSLPLTDENGEFMGSIIIFHDITERKKAEEELNKALEKEIDFRLKTAHYFFNPIAIAKGFLILAIEERGNGKLKKVLKALERVEKVIKNIVEKGEITE
ncbi:MAG: hypothetical protein DRN11_04485 [Thermoplasmata archaeon]|nr:MAG: hypothetical protein DRN11_04485 [Thermoplasmata archaeon]